MIKSSRLRRFCRLAGLGVSVLFVIGWVLSLSMTITASHGRAYAVLSAGGIGIVMLTHPEETHFRKQESIPAEFRRAPVCLFRHW